VRHGDHRREDRRPRRLGRGAIAAGLGLVARGLNRRTAQLPRVVLDGVPDPWGYATETALAAGVFWGTVGAVRELIARQDPGGAPPRPRIWTGGDGEVLGRTIDGPGLRLVPDLVLAGVAKAAFGIPPGRFLP
jgi:type III pantothenate kinase